MQHRGVRRDDNCRSLTVQVYYDGAGRSEEIWKVKELQGNWVLVEYGGGDWWTNFDNVVYYSAPRGE